MAKYTNNSTSLATIEFDDGTAMFLLNGHEVVTKKKVARMTDNISVDTSDEKPKKSRKLKDIE